MLKTLKANKMNSVKIDRVRLLEIVNENHRKHVQEYDEAVEDYKAAAVKLAQQNLKLAKSGDMEKIAKIRSMPNKPVSYEDNYVRAIRMLELSVDDVIEIEEHVFNQLVLDEWGWKQQFATLAATYRSV